ncbi:MAG TPA: DNA-binding protein YbiB [Methyloversatilis sp.]
MDHIKLIKEIGRGAKGSRALSREDAQALFGDMLDGRVPPLQLGAIVMAMRIKSEALDELLGFKAAIDERIAHIDAPAGPRTVVLPTYNGARRRPNLMPLLALMLAQDGIPVLIHGHFDFETRADPFALLDALDLPLADSPEQAGRLLESRRIACIRLEKLSPGLHALLSLRTRLGVRNAGHSMAKMIDPMPGHSVRVVSVTHPEYLEKMAHFLRLDGGRAMLLRGTEGEVYANPARRPQMTGFFDGEEKVLCEAEDGGALLTQPEDGIDAATNAQIIRDMLAGHIPIPEPLRAQHEACLSLCAA